MVVNPEELIETMRALVVSWDFCQKRIRELETESLSRLQTILRLDHELYAAKALAAMLRPHCCSNECAELATHIDPDGDSFYCDKHASEGDTRLPGRVR